MSLQYGKPIDLGNIFGRKIPRYVVGRDYDWTYRLCAIKALSDYSAFYLMCPLRGPTFAGDTLKAAVEYIDLEHAAEGAYVLGEGPQRPENVYDLHF